jgi:glutaminyl-peptide cyclotransferase
MATISGTASSMSDSEYRGLPAQEIIKRAKPAATPQKAAGLQNAFLAFVLIAAGITLYFLWPASELPIEQDPFDPQVMYAAPEFKAELKKIPFDGAQAYEYLKQLCAIGTRVSGSPGMTKQQKLLEEHFKKLGGTVTLQKFQARDPLSGKQVELANLIVTWHPDRDERIMLSAHYDTRPFPDNDQRHPRGLFVGANDGASGVALLMELGRHMPKLESKLGVDFVLFDGEELVYYQFQTQRDLGDYFLGSTEFAKDYVAKPPKHRYKWAVNLDMVGDRNLKLPFEEISWSWPECRPLIEEIWGVAKKLGVSEFSPTKGREVLDDHIKLHDIGKIPAIDIIDFDYPAWHTVNDKPEQCSPLSLAKVGWVLHEWLKQTK